MNVNKYFYRKRRQNLKLVRFSKVCKESRKNAWPLCGPIMEILSNARGSMVEKRERKFQLISTLFSEA
jgi:hypothetical protein